MVAGPAAPIAIFASFGITATTGRRGTDAAAPRRQAAGPEKPWYLKAATLVSRDTSKPRPLKAAIPDNESVPSRMTDPQQSSVNPDSSSADVASQPSATPAQSPAAPVPPVPWADRLAAAIRSRRSAVCVGLDPRAAQLPAGLRPAAADDPAAVVDPAVMAEAYRRFCCGIIDAVADLVPAVKPQAAFFEALGPAGMVALGQVIQHATASGLLVILDGKRNDIGSTAQAYAEAYLGPHSGWRCDSLTVSPYLGDDSLEPFVEACDRTASGIFVLVKTSNPGGGFLQDQAAGGQPIYRHVAHWVAEANRTRRGSSGYGPVGAVVGATYPQQLAELRQAMPGTVILIPGFGAQGGAASDVAAGFDDAGLGALVNNSRHILFAYQRREYADQYGDPRWQDAARAATVEMNQQLNSVRPSDR